jgi:hypothetical protein
VNLFGAGTASFTVNGSTVGLEQKTNYPWEGSVQLLVTPAKTSEFELRVRIPGWANDRPVPGDLYTFSDKLKEQPKLLLNGKAFPYTLDKGYAVLKRKWKKGDVVTLDLPMPVRKVQGNDSIEADRDKYAYQRGPLVYCAEWPDHGDKKVLNLVIPDNATVKSVYDPAYFNGMYVLQAEGKSVARTSDTETKATDTQVKLIPYFSWAHRGPGEMMVWIPRKPTAAQPLPAPTVASTSKISASYNIRTLLALNDQMEPKNSNDQSIIFYHWWPMKDTVQFVQYDFAKSETISSSKVYWFDDGPFGGCRIPAGWRLLYKDGEQWLPVKTKTPYAVLKDKYSAVTFEPVTTTALKLEVTLPKEHSTGMLEWSVF